VSGPPTTVRRATACAATYSRIRPDHTVEQDYGAYAEADQDRWRRLYRRQIELVPGRACDEHVEALNGLDYAGGIPRFEAVTAQLENATGWRLVAVPGLVPDLVFFEHLAFFAATAPDFTPLYRELQTLEDVPANAALPEDRLIY
jgi:phenylalanine-4-hydroxylase